MTSSKIPLWKGHLENIRSSRIITPLRPTPVQPHCLLKGHKNLYQFGPVDSTVQKTAVTKRGDSPTLCEHWMQHFLRLSHKSHYSLSKLIVFWDKCIYQPILVLKKSLNTIIDNSSAPILSPFMSNPWKIWWFFKSCFPFLRISKMQQNWTSVKKFVFESLPVHRKYKL